MLPQEEATELLKQFRNGNRKDVKRALQELQARPAHAMAVAFYLRDYAPDDFTSGYIGNLLASLASSGE